MFDPTQLDDVAARFERRAADLEAIRDRLGVAVGGLDWQGKRADQFRDRWADRRGDFVARAAELRGVATAVKALAKNVRRVLAVIAGIERAVRAFFADLAQAVEHAARAAADVGEAFVAAVTLRPGRALDELKQAVGHVMAALPWQPDNLPPAGSHEWFRVDDDLSGRGQDGVYYAATWPPQGGGMTSSLVLSRDEVAALVLEGHQGLAVVDGNGLAHVDADPEQGWLTLAAEPGDVLDAIADLLGVILTAEERGVVIEVVRDAPDRRSADLFATVDGLAVAVLAGPPGDGDDQASPATVTLVDVAPATLGVLVLAAAGWDEDDDTTTAVGWPAAVPPVARLSVEEVAGLGDLASLDRQRAITRLHRSGLDQPTAAALAEGLAGPCRSVTVRARRGSWSGEVTAIDDASRRRWTVATDRSDDGTPVVLLGPDHGEARADVEALLAATAAPTDTVRTTGGDPWA